jgi:hypothetical protein
MTSPSISDLWQWLHGARIHCPVAVPVRAALPNRLPPAQPPSPFLLLLLPPAPNASASPQQPFSPPLLALHPPPGRAPPLPCKKASDRNPGQWRRQSRLEMGMEQQPSRRQSVPLSRHPQHLPLLPELRTSAAVATMLLIAFVFSNYYLCYHVNILYGIRSFLLPFPCDSGCLHCITGSYPLIRFFKL